MTNESARGWSNVFLILAVLTLLGVCANCCSNSQKGSYGPEEFYSRGDGTVGYGAKYYNSSTDQSMLVVIIGGTLFLGFMGTSAYFHNMSAKLPTEEQLTEELRDKRTSAVSEMLDSSAEAYEPLFNTALRLVVTQEIASVQLVQTMLRVHYARAKTIIDAMVELGYVGNEDYQGNRPVLIKAYKRLQEISDSELP